MHRLLIILTVIFSTNCFAQKQEEFEIREYVNVDSVSLLDKGKFNLDKSNFFEDSLFVVSTTCSGEWGGTVKFKDKMTGIQYSATSTCPVVVNKLEGKYFITNTLAHLNGFSEILEIDNPKLLTVAEKSKPIKKHHKPVIRQVGYDESKSTTGTTKILDSVGVLTMASFPFKGHLYHVVTDFEKTYLTKIVAGRFQIIDTISNQRLWTYDPVVFKTSDKHYIVFFDNNETSGYFDIYENKIKIARIK